MYDTKDMVALVQTLEYWSSFVKTGWRPSSVMVSALYSGSSALGLAGEIVLMFLATLLMGNWLVYRLPFLEITHGGKK